MAHRETATLTGVASSAGLGTEVMKMETVIAKIVKEEELVKTMVDRFLSWRLPDNFCPDAGISFEPEYNVEYMAKQGKPPMRHEPVGTNLFDAEQVEQMVRHMLGLSA